MQELEVQISEVDSNVSESVFYDKDSCLRCLLRRILPGIVRQVAAVVSDVRWALAPAVLVAVLVLAFRGTASPATHALRLCQCPGLLQLRVHPGLMLFSVSYGVAQHFMRVASCLYLHWLRTFGLLCLGS